MTELKFGFHTNSDGIEIFEWLENDKSLRVICIMVFVHKSWRKRGFRLMVQNLLMKVLQVIPDLTRRCFKCITSELGLY